MPIPDGEGGHGGGDAQLLSDVFDGADSDPLGRRASWLDGVRSVAVGLAGNRSLETGQAVATPNSTSVRRGVALRGVH